MKTFKTIFKAMLKLLNHCFSYTHPKGYFPSIMAFTFFKTVIQIALNLKILDFFESELTPI
ncbi:hypothetical protein DB44_CH00030 [Candidatus Protochlamydia amoebophila]|uniref:Uncharacterized protein n=1 Tax=Candidatus Protochlamydia amoebophila TaxID=362787 RepID=A0A0C1HCH2_9BACT|nr:hypothetical protein DB44_CH00030 [Candidatus Protochlamydia amoebophila]